MGGSTAKPLVALGGRPMVTWVIEKAKRLRPARLIVVESGERLISAQIKDPEVSYVVQDEPNGTAQALAVARDVILPGSDVLILLGDSPLVDVDSVTRLVHGHVGHNAAMTVLSVITTEPYPFTELTRDSLGKAISLVRTTGGAGPRELSAGPLVIRSEDLLKWVDTISEDNGERRIEMMVSILAERGEFIHSVVADSVASLWGINTQDDLLAAGDLLDADARILLDDEA